MPSALSTENSGLAVRGAVQQHFGTRNVFSTTDKFLTSAVSAVPVSRTLKLSDNMPGNCHFQTEWLSMPEYREWIQRSKNASVAVCKLCNKTLDISTMGTSALRSHMRGTKHAQAVISHRACVPISLHAVSGPSTSNVAPSGPSASNVSTSGPSNVFPVQLSSTASTTSQISGSNSVAKFALRKDTVNAEILWAMKTVESGFSFRSCDGMAQLWKRQFPDSEIAQATSLGETKCMYMIVYGIGPFCKNLLRQKVFNEPFVLMFDESPNHKLQEKQLDVLVRFWDGGYVRSHYLSSSFMGHGTAKDLLKHILLALDDLSLKQVLQLSMDGPNVNWSLYNKVNQTLKDDHGAGTLCVGSCGLHVLHNSFKAGVEDSGWEVHNFLDALYILFDSVPARREDYVSVTSEIANSGKFPLKWCPHRWLENESVAQRAIEMLNPLKEYMKAIDKGKAKNPGTKSSDRVRKFVRDPLCEAKLACFVSVARQIEPFLKFYQTDSVVIPYLSEDLEALLKKILRRFVNVSVDLPVHDLIAIDLDSSDTFPNSKVDIGFVAEKLTSDLVKRKKVSSRDVFQFREQGRKFFKAIVLKLLKKSPLKFKLTRVLKCLNPKMIVTEPDVCIENFKGVTQCLVEVNRLESSDVDKVVDEFSDWISAAKISVEFCEFSKEQPLDSFYFNNFPKTCYPTLWKVVRELLLVSHGQAAVERGFSIGKALAKENQLQETIVNLRLVKDYIISVGGTEKVNVSKDMLTSVMASHRRYTTHLEKKRDDLAKKQVGEKRKVVAESIEILQNKKKCMEVQVKNLQSESWDMFNEAEKDNDMLKVVKGNMMAKKVTELGQELVQLKKKIESKELELKNTV